MGDREPREQRTKESWRTAKRVWLRSTVVACEAWVGPANDSAHHKPAADLPTRHSLTPVLPPLSSPHARTSSRDEPPVLALFQPTRMVTACIVTAVLQTAARMACGFLRRPSIDHGAHLWKLPSSFIPRPKIRPPVPRGPPSASYGSGLSLGLGLPFTLFARSWTRNGLCLVPLSATGLSVSSALWPGLGWLPGRYLAHRVEVIATAEPGQPRPSRDPPPVDPCLAPVNDGQHADRPLALGSTLPGPSRLGVATALSQSHLACPCLATTTTARLQPVSPGRNKDGNGLDDTECNARLKNNEEPPAGAADVQPSSGVCFGRAAEAAEAAERLHGPPLSALGLQTQRHLVFSLHSFSIHTPFQSHPSRVQPF